ncbi:hypothetical protein [Streptomyces sp. NPDC088812]|uniref:hypothetical protein n=1 Tax=Streptomyces sp. NPDC088812 TaxID=3365905 RepID=UPI0037FD5425
MLNPVIRWEPGILVRYHGSLTALHGIYRAFPCGCLNCDDPRLGTVRYQLLDDEGEVVASCVRPGSATPTDDEEPEHEECCGTHRSGDGYRDCDGTPL